MRSEFSVLAVVSTIMVLAALCPEHIRQNANDRVTIPEQVHVEAERQFDLFVSWIKQDGLTPSDNQGHFTEQMGSNHSVNS